MILTGSTRLPCISPDELAAWHAAQRRIGRGVDVGPATAAGLLATVERLAHIVTTVETLAQRAQHDGGCVDPHDVYAAISGPTPERNPSDRTG